MSLSKSGESWSPELNLNKLENVKRKPARPSFFPYFIFNIDDGRRFKGCSPNDAIVHIANNGFFGMDLAEAVQYPLHADLLTQPFANYACATRCADRSSDRYNFVPGLIKDEGGPRLVLSPCDQPRVGWSCPSYQTFRRAASLQGIISPKAWIKMSTWEKIRDGFHFFRKPQKISDDADLT